MACRVGMAKAANVQDRIDHWKSVEGYRYHEILASGLSYSQATDREADEAKARGCRSSAGGPSDSDHDWMVYHLWGD